MSKSSTSKDSKKKKKSTNSKKRASTKKPSKKGSVSKRQKKQVKRAIEKLPGLIMGHQDVPADRNEPKPPIENPPVSTGNGVHQHSSFEDDVRRQKKRFVFIGVSALTLLIVGMWFLNVKTFVYTMRNVDKDESAFLKAAQIDFNDIISDFELLNTSAIETSENSEIQTNKDEINNVLSETLFTIITSSTEGIVTSTSSTDKLNP